MKGLEKYRTDYLFSRPSFMIGAGSVLNIAGNYFTFNYSETDLESDTKAISSDWSMIGKDFELAINELNTQSQNDVVPNTLD